MKKLLLVLAIFIGFISCDNHEPNVFQLFAECPSCDTMEVWFNVGPRLLTQSSDLDKEWIIVDNGSWYTDRESPSRNFEIEARSNCDSDIRVTVLINDETIVDTIGNPLKIKY